MSRYICEIPRSDAALQHQMDALLQREGIRRDSHLEYSCGLFEDETLLAAGSLYHNTLRCLAVDDAHHGEGMMNQIVGHLTQAALCRGYSHLFLYTKPKNARLFEPLGFFPIAQVPELVFMENRRHGFSDYLHALQAQARHDFGQTCRIYTNVRVLLIDGPPGVEVDEQRRLCRNRKAGIGGDDDLLGRFLLCRILRIAGSIGRCISGSGCRRVFCGRLRCGKKRQRQAGEC